MPMNRLVFALLFLPLQAALACDTCKTPSAPRGRVVEYDLHIAEQTVQPAGRAVRGLTINGAPDPRVAVTNTGRNGTAQGSVIWTP